ncbi:GPALPP motifs-containing protein 1-like [Pollicipes pollicipes]|uniref:GPALPP motifs-containing protein 1-like n=1 Tax=Pollicipes pollicipes TaxID=41117 RepID=UPI00188520EC|nr:GPALPP motifs-containing protein 1-like [Pollicipes pollicipes]
MRARRQSDPPPIGPSRPDPGGSVAADRPPIGPSRPDPGGSAAADRPTHSDPDSSSDEDAYGPALPPGFVRRAPAGPAVKGPALPPGGLPPPAEDEEDEDDIIGPLPPAASADLGQYAADEVERRASSMKDKLDALGRPVELVREEWMLELPPERAGEFGLGPRQFRRSAAPERGDTSAWTEVASDQKPRPAATSKKRAEAVVDLATRRRDERMAEVAESLQASRKDSLLDLHQKKVKQGKKEAGDTSKRRQEFDRDRDLGTNRFDESQRAAAIKRSRGAADMFGAGAQKFL